MRTKQKERETAEYFVVLEKAGELQLVPSTQKDDPLIEHGLTWLWLRCKFLAEFSETLVIRGYSVLTRKDNLYQQLISHDEGRELGRITPILLRFS